MAAPRAYGGGMSTILITGATSGLGRYVAFELVRSGHVVLAHGRDPGRTEQLVAELRAEGDAEDAPAVARRGRTLLYEKMDGAYNYRSLFAYKRKFGVRWETRYLVYAGDAALPAALSALARAHLPSPRSLLPRRPQARAGRLRMGQQARGARAA